MKRIEFNTGEIKKGFWNGNNFEYKLKSKVASYEYNIAEDKLALEIKNAKAFININGGSVEAIEIWDVASGKEIFVFEIEDVDEIIKNSPSHKFLIYLENTGENLFICTSGIRNAAIPKAEIPEVGDFKIFTKKDLKNGYLSAHQEFEKSSASRGAIKLHIHQLPD